jgi:hypothetical protein
MTNFRGVIQQLKAERDRIDEAIAALASLNGTQTTSKRLQTRRRTMSVAARARISAAQKARWAAQKDDGKVVTITSRKPKRHISPAGLARIRAAARARWARVRATKKKSPSNQISNAIPDVAERVKTA